MIKTISIFLLILLNSNASTYTLSDGLYIKDLKSKEVLAKHNETKKISPASLTKILSAIVVLEKMKKNDEIKITSLMTQVEPTKLGLKIGDTIKASDLLKVMLIASSNDAARALSIYYGNGITDQKKEEDFIKQMNEKAKKIGMKNSNFTNASGFDLKNHYTTVHDLVLLSEYAIKNKTFNEIVMMKEYEFITKNNKKYKIKSHNKALLENDKVIGLKTGYTQKAGKCVITRIKDEKRDLLVILTNSKIDRWLLISYIEETFFN